MSTQCAEPVHAVEVEAPQPDGLEHENDVVAHEGKLETQAVVDVRQQFGQRDETRRSASSMRRTEPLVGRIVCSRPPAAALSPW
jgi:hypothetical protein